MNRVVLQSQKDNYGVHIVKSAQSCRKYMKVYRFNAVKKIGNDY